MSFHNWRLSQISSKIYDDPSATFPILSEITVIAAWDESHSIHRRFDAIAATAVVPEPAKKSATKSPGFDADSTILVTSDSGF
jgi:hypothetical protein